MIHASRLDFVSEGGTGKVLGMILLAVALAALGAMIAKDNDLRQEISREQARVNRDRHRSGSARDTVDEATLREIERANGVIDQLALPWGKLVEAIEAVRMPGVVLLGMTPDPHKGQVDLSGEARDADTMFAYVRALADYPGLGKVNLVHHQQVGSALRFQVQASWVK